MSAVKKSTPNPKVVHVDAKSMSHLINPETTSISGSSTLASSSRPVDLPAYLRDVYSWAYLTPSLTAFLDSQVIVQFILWGNARRLTNRVLREISPGWTILQPAAVYGVFSRRLASAVGSQGRLDVRDIAPLQVDITKKKLENFHQANVELGDAALRAVRRSNIDYSYNAITCFFLLHEVPEEMKYKIVSSLLSQIEPENGGEKVVFVDYHRPSAWHPLRGFMRLIFKKLEPFALALWDKEIWEYASPEMSAKFNWKKETLFGGLYQVVIATPKK